METKPETRETFETYIPTLISRFKSLGLNYSDEFVINEVNDPFLQFYILKFFRICLQKKKTIDKQLQTLLESIPAEIKIVKNTGNAVLYECALTIVELSVDDNCKQAGFEIINRMLTYKDVNSK
jgi:hypothetical protein